MIRLTIAVSGTRAVTRRLAAEAERAQACVRDHLREVAGDIAMRAKARVLAQRESDRPLPSSLAESIATVEEPPDILVAAGAPHAAFAEFGTVRMAAEPFLAPAFDEAVEALHGDAARGAGR